MIDLKFKEIPAGGGFRIPNWTYYFEPPENSPDKGWLGRPWIFIRIGRSDQALDVFSGFPRTIPLDQEVKRVEIKISEV